MQKTILMLCIASMILAFAACGQGNAPEKTGGWTVSESGEISPEAQAAFDKAMNDLVGVHYTPLVLLGTQLVSGTNYCFLCEAATVYPDAQPYYALVSVYENLQGEASILNILALNLGDIAETGEVRDSNPAASPMLGAWVVDRESSVEVDGAVLHLATQTVAGKNHCVLCKGWTLCFVYEDLEGKTETLRTVPLGAQSFGASPEDSGAN